MGIFNIGANAEGASITDSKGNIYIDCSSGYGIGNLGHNNPQIVNALLDQLKKGEVNSKPFINKIQVELAELLKEISPGNLECSFLVNSGSEAVETALKLIRLYKGEKKIISMENSFHGFTFGALSVSGVPAFKKSYSPLLPSFEQVPFGDLNKLESVINESTAAVFLEPVQHDAGIKIPSREYLQSVRKLCTERNIILVFDEVITGMGKTGFMFASNYFEVEPDILIIGKSLGAGLVPIGAVIARKDLWQRLGMSFPMTATSYGGNSLACRAAIESIKILRSDSLLKSVRKKSKILNSGLKKIIYKFPDLVKSLNCIGLLCGLELVDKKISASLVRKMIDKKVIVYQSFGNPFFIMIEPPLIISTEQIERVIEAFDLVLNDIKMKGI
jgi:putrescine aminotransferase